MTELGPNTLSELLSGGIFNLFLIMSRVGVAFMFLPGFGDIYVSGQKRFLLAVAISFVLLPALWGTLPAMPSAPADIMLLYLKEILLGLFIGLMSRLMLLALDLAGFIIASNAGLSAATSFNPQMSSSGPVVTNLLTMSAILVIFVTNTHHAIIGALVSSYTVFTPGGFFPASDIASTVTGIVSHSFELGFQLAAPFIILGLVFNVGLGLLARLVPQMQVFMVGVPLQILMGLAILAMVMMSIVELWLTDFESVYLGLFR
jgi:flagellar biosynthetic protein FliR